MTDPATPAQVDIEKLEALAKAATPGPWRRAEGANEVWLANECSYLIADCHSAADTIDADAAFIAAMNPAVALALIAEVRAHRAREVFLECPACEQPCRAMPGEPSYQWWDGDSGECACGAKVTVEADGECAELVLVEQDNETPPAVKEPR